MIDYIIFFIVAVFFGSCFTWIVRYYALKLNIVNKPNPIIPQHIKPIAYLGGVGILAAITIVLFYSYFFQATIFNELYRSGSPILSIITGSIGYLLWGVYDDLKQLKPLRKFIGQLVLAVICVFLNLKVSFFHIPYLDFLFSVFWILLIVNAVNFTDVCDGLVGGICVVTFLTVGILSPNLRDFCFLVSGATLGFLFFNLPKASIFLGDAGSHLLGFLLACAGILGSNDFYKADGIIWMVFISSVPLFELLFITLIRVSKGKPWWKGSPDHFSLRLQKAGLTRWQIDALAGGISAIVVGIGCVLPSFKFGLKLTSIITIISMYAFLSKVLLKWEVKK